MALATGVNTRFKAGLCKKSDDKHLHGLCLGKLHARDGDNGRYSLTFVTVRIKLMLH